MTAEYPKESQNPPEEPGMRPDDQPPPKVRVPDDEPNVDEMTTDERMREDPKRKDVAPPFDNGSADSEAVRKISDG